MEQEYATEISNKFEILQNLGKENIKTIIKKTKQQLIEKDEFTKTFKNKWYDKECKFAVEEMKNAREKCLIKGRREKDEQGYHHKWKEAHKIIRNKKKTYVKNVIESIEEDQKHKNTKKNVPNSKPI